MTVSVNSMLETGQHCSARYQAARSIKLINTVFSAMKSEDIEALTLHNKVRGPDVYIPQQTGKPEQQRFTMQSGVLSSISSRQRSAISGRSLPERKDFGSTVCSSTDPPIPKPYYGLHPAMFSGKDSLFSVASITGY